MVLLSLISLGLLPLLATGQSSSTAPLANPTHVPCPEGVNLIRSAGTSSNQSLSPAEHSYVSTRAKKILPGAWKTYLENVKSTSPTPLPNYVSDILSGTSNGSLPTLGIAASGGGYRAALFAGGVLNSLDARNTTAAQKTGTGGLLQAAAYTSGLSGGGWTIVALAQANFPTVSNLIFPPQLQSSTTKDPNAAFGGFLTQFDFTNPGPDADATTAYLKVLLSEVTPKRVESGFPITVGDMWARGLARHFVNGTTAQNALTNGTHGAGVLFSDIAKLPSFISHQQPFPIIVSDTMSPHPNMSEVIPGGSVPLTDEIWEFNVFETGSFDPTLASFIPTALLGSTNSSNCVLGYDQAAFVAGASSNLFNIYNTSAAALLASAPGKMISMINDTFGEQGVRLDVSIVPNPFKGVNPETYSNTNETFISMLDGGGDEEVIPLQPLLVRARQVDTIIAIDADGNHNNYANGTQLGVTAKRAALYGSMYPFPPVPSTPDIFLQQNLSRRPTLFGCNDTTGAPLLIYIPNGGPPLNGQPAVTNTNTTQTVYSAEAVQAFLDQAFDISTQGIPTGTNVTDPEWGVCLACAVVDRARARSGAQRDGICSTCFERYCWSGNDTLAVASSGGSGGSGSSSGARRLVSGAFWASLAGMGVVICMGI